MLEDLISAVNSVAKEGDVDCKKRVRERVRERPQVYESGVIQRGEVSGGVFDGVPVRCRRCKQYYHELTGSFEKGGPVRGCDLRLNAKYGPGGLNWYDFPHTEWTVGANVVCPRCGGVYTKEWLIREVVRFIQYLRHRSIEYAWTKAMANALGSNFVDWEIMRLRDEDGWVMNEDVASAFEDEIYSIVNFNTPGRDSDNGIGGVELDEEEIKAKVVRLYLDGVSQLQISKDLGISYYTVLRLVKEALNARG